MSVGQEVYDNLEARFEEAVDELNKLVEENANMRTEFNTLEKKYKRLGKVADQLEAKNEAYKQHIARYKQERDEARELAEQRYRDWVQLHQTSDAAYAKLQADYKAMQDLASDYRQQVEGLRQQKEAADAAAAKAHMTAAAAEAALSKLDEQLRGRPFTKKQHMAIAAGSALAGGLGSYALSRLTGDSRKGSTTSKASQRKRQRSRRKATTTPSKKTTRKPKPRK